MFFEKKIVHISDDGKSLFALDQTLLPTLEQEVELRSSAEVAEAIAKLRVRGAPLIGIAAAFGLSVAVANGEDFATAYARIGASRPTAVNLMWALNRLKQVKDQSLLSSNSDLAALLRREAETIENENASMCESIGSFGSKLINGGDGILTHCNAGHLATGHLGTALAPIYLAKEQGKHFKVFADETRPLLQGARLTAYELFKSGVDVTLICDNMVASLMAKGKINIVFVGCDRVAVNGDTANKIGTLGVAILAHHFGIPFYVCGPSSTFDSNCPTGDNITIEHRSAAELTSLHYRHPMAPDGISAYNPSFDVTPNELITGYITENGIHSTK